MRITRPPFGNITRNDWKVIKQIESSNVRSFVPSSRADMTASFSDWDAKAFVVVRNYFVIEDSSWTMRERRLLCVTYCLPLDSRQIIVDETPEIGGPFPSKLIFYDIISANEAPLIVSFSRGFRWIFNFPSLDTLCKLTRAMDFALRRDERDVDDTFHPRWSERAAAAAHMEALERRLVKCFYVVDLWKEFNCIHCADEAV